MKKGLRYKHYRSHKVVLTVGVELGVERALDRIGYSLCHVGAERYEREIQNARGASPRELDVHRDLYPWLRRDWIGLPHLGQMHVDGLSLQRILDELKLLEATDDGDPDNFREVARISGRLEEKIAKRSQ